MHDIEYKRLFECEERHWWFRAKRLFIQTLLPQATAKLKILDLGAGTGGTSIWLERWGMVTRVESSAVAINYLKQRKAAVIKSDIMTFRFPSQKFDLVTCFDVLYHKKITNDRKVLTRIFRTLKAGGLLCITDCAVPALYSPHDERNQARLRYTKKQLEQLVSAAGFTIVRSSYIYFLLFPLFLISRITERFSNHTDVATPPAWLNTLLFQICQWEAVLLEQYSFPIGSSVILLARKSVTERGRH